MKTRKRILSILLTLALAAGLLAIAPITASAAPASIDVSTLIDGGGHIFAPAGDDSWYYDDTIKMLHLTKADGSYTLTGTNANLRVIVDSSATGANVILNGVDIDSYNFDALTLNESITVTLLGSNILSSSSGKGLNIFLDKSVTINGSGSLTASGIYGIYLFSSSTLRITGTASVTAVNAASLGLAQLSGSSILIGDNAKLTTNNNTASALTYTFGKDGTATTHKWKLTGATLEAGYELTDDEIEVTVAPGDTATIEREPKPAPDKGIFCTNARWYGEWWHYVLFFLGFGFLWMWF